MNFKYCLSILRTITYWGLPPLIIYIIFSRINFERFIQIVVQANQELLTLGLIFIVITIILGSLRWYLLSRFYKCIRLTFIKSLIEYWISIAMGAIVPGSLGSDAYRIALGGRQTGYFLRCAFVIGIEKLAALFSCAVLIVCIFPFLAISKLPDTLIFILNLAYFFLSSSFAIIVLAVITHKVNWTNHFINILAVKIYRLANKIKTKVKGNREEYQEIDSELSPSKLIYLAFKPRLLFPTIFISFCIHAVSALQSQIFFHALGYELPLIVNLFVAPLILLAFMLPISFGGIGIREGAYILFYGIFGVPSEIALVVSYFALLSVLLSYAIGSMLTFYHRYKCPD